MKKISENVYLTTPTYVLSDMLLRSGVLPSPGGVSRDRVGCSINNLLILFVSLPIGLVLVKMSHDEVLLYVAPAEKLS